MIVYYDYVFESTMTVGYTEKSYLSTTSSSWFILEDVHLAYLNVSPVCTYAKSNDSKKGDLAVETLHSDVTSVNRGYWGSQECRQNDHDTLFPFISGDRHKMSKPHKISRGI